MIFNGNTLDNIQADQALYYIQRSNAEVCTQMFLLIKNSLNMLAVTI